MKAVVQDRYGPPEVLRVGEVERPVPRDDEVLIRVRASTVSQTDAHVRAANPAFWRLIGGVPPPGGGALGGELARGNAAGGGAAAPAKDGGGGFGSPSRDFCAHPPRTCP